MKVSFEGSLISKPLVLIRSGLWSSISDLLANVIFEIDQPAVLVLLFVKKNKYVSGVH